MFRSDLRPLDAFVCLFAHAGEKPDDRGNRVYAVSAMRLSRSGERKRFDSLIRYPHFSARDHHYSAITKKDLAEAPDLDQVRTDLNRFMGDAHPLLRLGLDAEPAGDLDISDRPCIDLGFAAEFFLPHYRSHTFSAMWTRLMGGPRDRFGFSAAEAVDLSVALIRHICGDVLCTEHTPHAPVLRHYLDKSDTVFGRFFLHVCRHFQDYFGGGFSPYSESATGRWRPFLEKSRRPATEGGAREAGREISEANVRDLFLALAGADDAFTVRPAQMTYARPVVHAFNQRAVLTLEAGTGTGKTQGYLIPAMEFLRLNPGAQVVISTYTKSLQEQIFQKEIPVTRSLLPAYHAIDAALLKGKSSYLCAEKLGDAYDDTMTGADLLSWLYCVHLTVCFRTADRDSAGPAVQRFLNEPGGSLDRLFRETAAGSGCTPGHRRCPAQVVTAEAVDADLIITNHHKLALLDRDPILSGRFKNYIIDEANHFEHAVRNAFGSTVSSKEIRAILGYVEFRLQRMAAMAEPRHAQALSGGLSAVADLKDRISALRETLSDHLPRSGYGVPHVLTHDHPLVSDQGFLPDIRGLSACLRAVTDAVDIVRDEAACARLRVPPATARRLIASAEQLGEYADILDGIGENVTDENHITACQLFKQNWILTAQWVAVGDLIRRHFFARKERIVLTAATLAHGGCFQTFKTLSGMDDAIAAEESAASRFLFEQIPSPYGRENMEIVLHPEAVSGKYENKEVWLERVSDLIPRLVAENAGRTLVLFASYEDLNTVVRRIQGRIDETRYPLLIQRAGQATAGLCDMFRDIQESVLFGVDTFWYGVDFKGDTLTQVIITRIPYPNPGEPLQLARKKLMSAEDYWKRYRYDTDMKMRQGIGRLIRSHTDRGRVVILDSRYRP